MVSECSNIDSETGFNTKARVPQLTSHPWMQTIFGILMGIFGDLLCKVDVHFWISGVVFEGFGKDVDVV